MADTRPEPTADLGIYGRTDGHSGLDTPDRLALYATAAWLVAALLFWLFVGWGEGGELGPLRFLIVLLAIFLPIALIWIAAIALKSARIIREESERLKASMDAMRQIYVSQAQIAATTMGPNVESDPINGSKPRRGRCGGRAGWDQFAGEDKIRL